MIRPNASVAVREGSATVQRAGDAGRGLVAARAFRGAVVVGRLC
jgi:hypothetical protein